MIDGILLIVFYYLAFGATIQFSLPVCDDRPFRALFHIVLWPLAVTLYVFQDLFTILESKNERKH